MTRERVAGGGSSIVAPKPVRNASSVRIVPSIQSEAISLIADIFTWLHWIRAGPSRPDRELIDAGLLRGHGRGIDVSCRMSVGFARGDFFVGLLADDRLADGDMEFACEVVFRVALGDGVAQLLAHRAHVAADCFDFGRGRQADCGPQRREERAGDRGVEALVAQDDVDCTAEDLADGGTGEDTIGGVVGSADNGVVRLPAYFMQLAIDPLIGDVGNDPLY